MEKLCGSPQGGVTSPVIFAFYISSLKPISDNICYVKFADDLTVIHYINKPSDDKLQEELLSINSWYGENNMLINLNKTKWMIYSKPKNLILRPISRNNVIIEEFQQCKLLGFIISDNMKLCHHVDSVVKRSNKKLYTIIQLKRALSLIHI